MVIVVLLRMITCKSLLVAWLETLFAANFTKLLSGRIIVNMDSSVREIVLNAIKTNKCNYDIRAIIP